ncbi:MAG: oligosaccharide flippase family protein [Actinomycetota bacterium]|nr:oligosaccharide flippase family protein [Actinomycetota bacterium]
MIEPGAPAGEPNAGTRPPDAVVPPAEGTVAGEAERIVSHSLAGTRWILWLSATALACGFGTNVVLGRSDPELLGYYGLLTLTLSLVGVFFVVGGGNVLVNYLPKLDPSDKTSFLAAYAAVVVFSGAALLAVAVLVPAVPDLIYGDAAGPDAVRYLALFLPIGIAQMIAWSTLQADLALRSFAVSQALVSALTFVVLVVGAMGDRLASQSARNYVLGAVVAANVASAAVALARLWRRQFRSWGRVRRLLVPEGFWRFSLYFHAGSIVSFAIRSLDQVYVLRGLGLVSLGYYRSALVLAQLASFLMVVTDKGFYSTFCNVRADEHPRLHARFVRLNSVGTALAGLVLLLFSGELLALFGESATEESQTVLILVAGGILLGLPVASVNNSVVTAREKMNLILFNNAIGAVAAVSLYSTVGDRWGLVGIGWVFAGVQLLMLALSTVAARRVVGVPFPTAAWAVSLLAVATGAGAAVTFDAETVTALAAKAAIAAGFVPILLLTRLVTSDELKDLAVLVVPGRWLRLTRPAT